MDDLTKIVEAAKLVGYWSGVANASEHGYYATVDYDMNDVEFKLDCATATLEALLAERKEKTTGNG